MSLCSGSGVAGLTAALTASLSGLDAIIVEHRLDIGGTSARSSGRHERAKRFRVEDDVGDLAGLRRNEPAPNRVASRPRIFTLIVKTLRVPVHDDAEITQSRRVTMPPSNFGARASIATAWH